MSTLTHQFNKEAMYIPSTARQPTQLWQYCWYRKQNFENVPHFTRKHTSQIFQC